MEEQLVKFETAKLAKEKGFDEKTLYNYTNIGNIPEWDELEYVVEDFKDIPHYIFSVNSELVNGFITAPTQSLLQKWLRDKHKIRLYPRHGVSGNFNFEVYTWIQPNAEGKWSRLGNITSYSTYEGALEKGLQEALKLIK